MDDKRRRELRRRWLKAKKIVDEALEVWSGGLRIIRHVSSRVDTAYLELEAIAKEVADARATMQ